MLAVTLAVCLAWWPCGTRGPEVSYPSHRIPVIDSAEGSVWYRENLRAAMRQWTRCGGVRLVATSTVEPFAPGTITVAVDPSGPVGGFYDGHGIVYVNDPWTRTGEVLAHELGHALGFGHTNSNRSIMGSGHTVSALDCKGVQ